MSRKGNNLKILEIVKSNLTPDVLEIIDFKGSVEEFKYLESLMYSYIHSYPEIRFVQMLWSFDQNLHSIGEGDRFSEEPSVTLQLLKDYLKQ